LYIAVDQNGLGYILGDFFHKLIGSPWWRHMMASQGIKDRSNFFFRLSICTYIFFSRWKKLLSLTSNECLPSAITWRYSSFCVGLRGQVVSSPCAELRVVRPNPTGINRWLNSIVYECLDSTRRKVWDPPIHWGCVLTKVPIQNVSKVSLAVTAHTCVCMYIRTNAVHNSEMVWKILPRH
jgi:hypothetical protein